MWTASFPTPAALARTIHGRLARASDRPAAGGSGGALKYLLPAAIALAMGSPATAAVIDFSGTADLRVLDPAIDSVSIGLPGGGATVLSGDTLRYTVDFLGGQSLVAADLRKIAVVIFGTGQDMAAFSYTQNLDFLGASGEILWSSRVSGSGGSNPVDFSGEYAFGPATSSSPFYGVRINATMLLIPFGSPTPTAQRPSLAVEGAGLSSGDIAGRWRPFPNRRAGR